MNHGFDFSALLKRKMGLDGDSIGHAAIERAVRLRMTAAKVPDEKTYWNLLQSDQGELQHLIEAVVVPETWFFRYPDSLAVMGKLGRERLFGRRDDATLRILSLPCSTGEEPYSIAMALLDAGVPSSRFAIDALDISARVVQFAQHAVYGRNSFRGDNLQYRDRYFSESEDGYVLSPVIKRKVHFQQGNLFDPMLVAKSIPYDFVFCRNLLIYFDAATQEAAVHVLRSLTQNDGIIFVGPAEASLLTARRLPSIAVPGAFAFMASAAAQVDAPAAMNWPSVSKPPAAWTQTHPFAPVPSTSLSRAPLGRAPLSRAPLSRPPLDVSKPAAPIAPPLPVKEAAFNNDADRAAVALRSITALADQGLVDEALTQILLHLAEYEASADVLYLQGLLQDAAGRPSQARASYRKALYLDPSHREALLHLAALIASDGDHEGARRMQARAARGDTPRD